MILHSYILKSRGPTKGTLVFLHGFGGSCVTYHQFLSVLSDEYDVYAFDMLGCGCSSKPDLSYMKMTADQVIDLFSDCIHKWITALELKDFHLVGHSLGAYFGTFYMDRYAESVRSFSTVACAGATKEPNDFSKILKGTKLPFKRRAMKWFWRFMNNGYITGYTAFSCMPLNWIISKWIEGRMDISGEEKKLTVEFISSMFWDKGYSCDIITRIFGYLAYAQNPICHVIQDVEKKTPVMHIYGENDWLDRKAFQEFMKESKISLT